MVSAGSGIGYTSKLVQTLAPEHLGKIGFITVCKLWGERFGNSNNGQFPTRFAGKRR
jgi:hypothetical protein